jgi:uncharacterized protein
MGRNTSSPSSFMKFEGRNMCSLCFTAALLLVIGGLNWGLIGLAMLVGGDAANWNVVNLIFGSWPIVEAIIYLLVGISALYKVFMYPKCCGKM